MVATNPETQAPKAGNPYLLPFQFPMTLACLGNHDGDDATLPHFDTLVEEFITLARTWDENIQAKEKELDHKAQNQQEQVEFLDRVTSPTLNDEANPDYDEAFAQLDGQYGKACDAVVESLVRDIDEKLCLLVYKSDDADKAERATKALRKSMLMSLLRNLDQRYGLYMQNEMLKQIFGNMPLPGEDVVADDVAPDGDDRQ